MTLAACFRFKDGTPYLLGDALISQQLPSSNFDLPSNSNIIAEAEYEGVLVPTRLKQKIILLSDHLAFGWSGDWSECAALIREASNEFASDEVKGDDVTAFLESNKN